MSESMPQADEDRILSSLYGMTLAGLREMLKKRGNDSIKHLIVRAIELKESQTPEAKAKGPVKKRPSRAVR
jgi:hypothetical protein